MFYQHLQGTKTQNITDYLLCGHHLRIMQRKFQAYPNITRSEINVFPTQNLWIEILENQSTINIANIQQLGFNVLIYYNRATRSIDYTGPIQ